MPVHGAAAPWRGRVAPVRDIQQAGDPADLVGLLGEFAQQRRNRLLAVVGAASRQVPAAGPGIALGDQREQNPSGGVRDLTGTTTV